MIKETKQLNQKMDHRHTHTHSSWHRRKVDEYRENGISCKRLYNYKKVTKESASNHWMDSDGRPIDHLVWYFNESESGFNKDILVPNEIIIEDKGLDTFSEIKKDLWWHYQCSSYEWIQSKHLDKKKWKMFKLKTLHYYT